MKKVQTYDSIYLHTLDGQVPQASRTTMVIPYKYINGDGSIQSVSAGNSFVEESQAFIFIVDKGVPEEFHKLIIDTSGMFPELYIKDGEALNSQLTEEEQAIVALEQQLLIAKAKYNNNQINVKESGSLE